MHMLGAFHNIQRSGSASQAIHADAYCRIVGGGVGGPGSILLGVHLGMS